MARARFLHTADLHLSRRFGFLPPMLAEERRRDQRKALTRIADMATTYEVEVVLIAGDVFDTHDPDPTDLEAFSNMLIAMASAGKRVFIIPGNHDYVAANSFWYQLDIEGVHIFLDPEWSRVELEDLGIAITAAAFHKGKSERRAFEGLSLPKDYPSIVLAHGSYELFEGQIERYHPFSASELPGTEASYIALGHYHKFNSISADGVVACYPGTPEGISFDSSETEDRFIIIGEVTDYEVTYEPVKINQRTMRSLDIDCSSFESASSLLNVVRKFCEQNTLVEVRITGSPNFEVAGAIEGLPNRFKESCYYLGINQSNLSLPVDLPADDLTIRGRFCQYLLEQIERTTDPERKKLLQRALELGLTAFGEG